MANEPLERLADAFEAMNSRLSEMDKRFTVLEGHLADDAQATEESAKSLAKLQELYLSIDKRLEEMVTMLGNYVESTAGLRRETQRLLAARQG